MHVLEARPYDGSLGACFPTKNKSLVYGFLLLVASKKHLGLYFCPFEEQDLKS